MIFFFYMSALAFFSPQRNCSVLCSTILVLGTSDNGCNSNSLISMGTTLIVLGQSPRRLNTAISTNYLLWQRGLQPSDKHKYII